MKTHYSVYKKGSPIIFTCEHASPRIPRKYKQLGLTKKQLAGAKDLYDPGAYELMKDLAARFGASYIYSNISRLVADKSRTIDAVNKNLNTYHSALIKTHLLSEYDGSEQTVIIPHNQNVSSQQEKEIYKSICRPYQKDLKKVILKLLTVHKKVYIVSVHSFYPMYAGSKRVVEINGFDVSKTNTMRKMISFLNENYSFVTKQNKPWSSKDADDGAFKYLKAIPNTDFIGFDIKNDQLDSKTKVTKISKALQDAIMEVIL